MVRALDLHRAGGLRLQPEDFFLLRDSTTLAGEDIDSQGNKHECRGDGSDIGFHGLSGAPPSPPDDAADDQHQQWDDHRGYEFGKSCLAGSQRHTAVWLLLRWDRHELFILRQPGKGTGGKKDVAAQADLLQIVADKVIITDRHDPGARFIAVGLRRLSRHLWGRVFSGIDRYGHG